MHLKRQCDMSKCKVGRLKDQHALLEEEFVQLQLENLDLVSDKEDLDDKIVEASDADFNFLSTCKRYSPEIRKLYYTLLADQVPASKIPDIVRSVLIPPWLSKN